MRAFYYTNFPYFHILLNTFKTLRCCCMCWSYEDTVNNLHCMKSGFAGNSPSFLQLAILTRNKEQLSLFRFSPPLWSPSPSLCDCMVRHSLKPPLRFTSAPFPLPTSGKTKRMRSVSCVADERRLRERDAMRCDGMGWDGMGSAIYKNILKNILSHQNNTM